MSTAEGRGAPPVAGDPPAGGELELAARLADSQASAEGKAFPLLVRLLATGLVGAAAWSGAGVGDELVAADWTSASATVFILAMALVLWCLAWIWRSRTRVDAEGIHQTWMWNKQVRWSDITQAKFIAVPGMEWLIAPRFVVRSRGHAGVTVFHAAHPAVLSLLAARALMMGRG